MPFLCRKDQSAGLTLASYNVHQWRGTDGKVDPERTFEAIRRLRADVVALQEVNCPLEDGCGLSPEDIGRALEYEAILGPTLRRENADFGNLLLTRFPAMEIKRMSISRTNREPRGVIITRLESGEKPIWVAATHLGLSMRERRKQVDLLLNALRDLDGGPVVLMGDLNEWNPAGYVSRRLRKFFGRQPAPPTFPARRPIMALDRIFIYPYYQQTEAIVPGDRIYREASDHRPVAARFFL